MEDKINITLVINESVKCQNIMRYLVQPENRIFVKGCRFFYFAKIIGKSTNKDMSKNLSGKYKQKLLDHAKHSARDGFKTVSKQKAAEATGDLIGNKITDRITKLSKNSQQNKLETVTNGKISKEIPKERYISPEERKKIIDNLRVI